jgi:VanZ family protein
MIDSVMPYVTKSRILGCSCILVLAGILVAGLWPFHSPANQVHWLNEEQGLRFGDYGTILGDGEFAWLAPPNTKSCSLEIWIVPGLTRDSNTFLAFYRPSGWQFSLHQSETDLELLSENPGTSSKTSAARLYVDDVFHKGQPVFITITSALGQTVVYINGLPNRKSSDFPLFSSDWAGQLVLGTSPQQADTWSGTLRGLAVYGHDLTPSQVRQDYQEWTQRGRPTVDPAEGRLALYSFEEGSGRKIQDQSNSGDDLYIPEKFVILHEKLLEAPWNEYHPGWGYWTDILINIGGFVPLGFFFVAYFRLGGNAKRPSILTVLLGGVVSLSIEVLQAFLPTRDSGLTDVITNTSGTGLGVMLYFFPPARDLLNWVLRILTPADPGFQEHDASEEAKSQRVELAV